MNQISETWQDAFHGIIPKADYSMHLTQGEENGLLIRLESQEYKVTLVFGNVHGTNILDEGVQLNNPPGCRLVNEAELRANRFSSTLYLVEGGLYAAYVRACMTAECYDALHLRQYNLVTGNYVAEIITAWEPEIQISPIPA